MSVNDTVLTRDGYCCVRCGRLIVHGVYSIHHRLLRAAGGRDNLANLITLCGTGSMGCHGWVHGHVRAARDSGGWILSRYGPPPGEVPVLDRRRGWILLHDDGRISPARHEEAPGG